MRQPNDGGLRISRPTNTPVVGRVIPNAPNPAPIDGGLRISRPTNTPMVGRVIPNAPNPVSNDGSSCDADDAVARAQCERGAKPSTPQFSPTR